MWKKLAGAIAAGVILAAPASSEVTWSKASPGGGGAFLTADVAANGTVLVGTDLSGMYRRSGTGNWTRIGRLDGLDATSVEVIRWKPGQSDTALAGTQKGLYRSTNGGTAWSKITDVDISDRTVSGIAWIADTVFAVISSTPGDAQILLRRSTDRGQNWVDIGHNISAAVDRRCVKLAVGLNSNTLWLLSGHDRNVGGAKELWKGTVTGTNSSWAKVSDTHNAIDFALHSSQNIVVMTTSDSVAPGSPDDRGAVYWSLNGGSSWTPATSITSDATGAVWWDADSSYFYLINVMTDACITVNNLPPGRAGKFRSSDGDTWTRIDNGQGGPSGFGTAVWDTAWTNCTGARGRALSTVARTLSAKGEYWVSPQFVWRYTTASPYKYENTFTTQVGSGPATWITKGIDNAVPTAIVATGIQKYLAGYYDVGIWRTTNMGDNWENVNPSAIPEYRGTGGNVTGIAADGSTVWATMGARNKPPYRFRLWKSTNAGTSWDTLPSSPGFPDSSFMYGLSRDPGTGRLWVTADGRVYSSVSGGTSWTAASGGLPNSGIFVTQAKNDTVLVGGSSGLWRSTSPFSVWTEVDTNFNFSTCNPPDEGEVGDERHRVRWHGIHQILFDPNVANRVWVVSYYKHTGTAPRRKGVWRSDNNGVSFGSTAFMDSVLRRGVAIDSLGGRLHVTSGAATTFGVTDAAEMVAAVGKQTCHATTGYNFSVENCTVDTQHADYRFPFGWAVYSGGLCGAFVGVPGYGFMRQHLSCPDGGGGGCHGPPGYCETDGPGGGGGESAPGVDLGGAGDLAFELGQAQPSPSRGLSTLRWSIPQAEAGKSFELALFDIAGRRVAMLAAGIARAGRHSHELSFKTDQGTRLGNGVFFVRLRLGNQTLRRTVILAR